jgi:hypothetical protein
MKMMLNDLKLRFKSFSFSATPEIGLALHRTDAAQIAVFQRALTKK